MNFPRSSARKQSGRKYDEYDMLLMILFRFSKKPFRQSGICLLSERLFFYMRSKVFVKDFFYPLMTSPPFT